jgi:hypothetical protein
MIDIIRKNFQVAKVDDYVLDSLIASDRLIAFYRANQWVVIGKEAVRRQHTLYAGKERRRIIYGNDFCMK